MKRIAGPALAALLAAAVAAPAAPPDPGKIQEAIKRGAAALQKGGGHAEPGGHGAGHEAGLACLVGLALMEAGVKATDQPVAGTVQAIRAGAYAQAKTYDVSLMIVFLDRVNDPSDVPLIQLLGCRLLAGQNAAGGWGYDTWAPGNDEARIRSAVGAKDPKLIRPQPLPDPNEAPPTPPKLHPEAAKVYDAVRRGLRVTGPAGGAGDDNSNTQFAIVALWVAQRRGVPCGAAFRAIEGRFLRTQSPADYGWGYGGHAGGSTPSMTCAGLIGLAVATAYDARKLPTDRPDAAAPQQPNKPKDDDPFFNPPEGKAGGGDPDAPPPEEKEEEEKKANPIRDAAIARGLLAIGRLLKGNQGGQPGGGFGGDGGSHWGGVDDLYFLWSLERVAVGFGLETIDKVPWYDWGAEKLLAAQQPDGSWKGKYSSQVDTSFAILFLAKSNFVSDLTRNIRGKVKDPGVAELKGSKAAVGIGAAGSSEAVRAPGSGGAPAAAGPNGPGIAAVQAQTQAEKITEGLVKAKDGEWPGRLRVARDTKGGHYTAGLLRAVPQLEGKRQYQAREALVDRLTRMTRDTLKKYLADRDAELRRAAALAVGMKDDKGLIRDLIDRATTDIDEAVIRSARAALKSLTGEDFGPPPGATDKQKEDAQQAWLVWYNTTGRNLEK